MRQDRLHPNVLRRADAGVDSVTVNGQPPGGASGPIAIVSPMASFVSPNTIAIDNGNEKALADAAVTIIGIDVSLNQAFSLDLVADTRVMGSPTNLPAGTRKNGEKITFAIRPDALGRLFGWTGGAAGSYVFATSLGPTQVDFDTLLAATPANGVVMIGFQYHAGLDRWCCVALAGYFI